MRCAPLAIPYATNWDRLVEVSRQSSQITHADPRCTYGFAVLNLTLAGLLGDADTPLQDALDEVGSAHLLSVVMRWPSGQVAVERRC
jgi:ADP-ribosyl-[dinitrogen reductase] hydrolase